MNGINAKCALIIEGDLIKTENNLKIEGPEKNISTVYICTKEI